MDNIEGVPTPSSNNGIQGVSISSAPQGQGPAVQLTQLPDPNQTTGVQITTSSENSSDGKTGQLGGKAPRISDLTLNIVLLTTATLIAGPPGFFVCLFSIIVVDLEIMAIDPLTIRWNEQSLKKSEEGLDKFRKQVEEREKLLNDLRANSKLPDPTTKQNNELIEMKMNLEMMELSIEQQREELKDLKNPPK